MAASATLYIVGRDHAHALSSYKGTYSNEQSMGFAIAVLVVLMVGIIYVLSQRFGASFASFVLIGAASITMVYWVHHLKGIAKDKKPTFAAGREHETKNWVYDLIKDGQKFIFVAEVPGPDSRIEVRLVGATLHIRGSGGFSKEVPIDGADGMEINDFKYRNGVLTLRIGPSEAS